MAVAYSERYGLTEGLTRTFDGKNPCGLCEKITEARQESAAADHSGVLPPTKLVCVPAPPAPTTSAPLQSDGHVYFLVVPVLSPRADEPALPPPRFRAA